MARRARGAAPPTELAAGLVLARESAGLGQIALGEKIGLSQSHISHAERGRRLLSPEQVERFAQACERDTAETDRLVELARVASREHVDARSILQRGAITFQERVREMEDAATLVREFQPAMVTGVCQTVDYVRGIFRQRASRPAEEVERLAEQRVARGAALVADQRRRWEIVHTEGALSWCLGGPDVMAAQLEHLTKLSRLPHVRFGVIPARRPVDFTAHHGFSIYDSAAVQVGTVSSTALLRAGDDINDHAEKFQRLLGAAVFDDAARENLARIAARYREAMP